MAPLILATRNDHKLREFREALPGLEIEPLPAEVDLNVVMTGDERLVEVQATAERATFDREQLDELLDLGAAGIATIRAAQEAALDAPA